MTINEMRLVIARETIPLMQETYRQLVAIFEKHMNEPLPPEHLAKLGLTLSLNAREMTLFLVGYTDVPPRNMDRLKE